MLLSRKMYSNEKYELCYQKKKLLFHSVTTFYQKVIVTLNFCLKKIPESIMCDSSHFKGCLFL